MIKGEKDTRSNIYLGMIVIGALISIWVSFLIWISYPDITMGFTFAMFATWIVILFSWGNFEIGEFEKDHDCRRKMKEDE